MQEMIKFLDSSHNMVIVTGGPGARCTNACLKQLITPKSYLLVPGVELLSCIPAATIITVRLLRGMEAALVAKGT